MPELPEVEVTRLGLAPRLVGRRMVEVEVREPRLRAPVPGNLAAILRGQVLQALDRRGKFLLWRFDRGGLISHLGMTGVWRIHEIPAPPAGKHDHVDLVFEGAIARLSDPRRFGAIHWMASEEGALENHPALARLGLEPFDPRFEGDWLRHRLRGRTAPIKSLLLAGEIVVGVGNIYCSESLYRAGIHPATPAGQLGAKRCERLAQSVRQVLSEAIAAGGSTLRDFVSASGEEGYFMIEAGVYGREGMPCRACGASIRRIVQGQRATYFCPRCQRR